MTTKTSLFLLLVCFLGAGHIASFAQPCTPVASPYNCSSGHTVNDFFLIGDAGTSILDTATGCAGITGYDDRTYRSVTLTQGHQYTSTISTQIQTLGVQFAAWIDFNNNNIFEPGERVAFFKHLSTTGSEVIITIPPHAAVGTHRMRTAVDLDFFGSPLSVDPCTEAYWGERQDYTVVIQAGAACTGQPDAGTITGDDFICGNTTQIIVIRADGFSEAGDFTYSWVAKPINAANFTLIPGAADNYLTPLPTDTTTYGFVITCPGSGLSDTSFFDINVKKFYQCYCNPSSPMWSNFLPMDTVKIPGTTLDFKLPYTNISPNSPGFMPPTVPNGTATLEQGGVYTLRIKSKQSLTHFSLWIDYDHNGLFDASEYRLLEDNTALNTVSLSTIVIPENATTGVTGMRLIASKKVFTPADVCFTSPFYTDYSYRETQNFLINIAPGTNCAGAPQPGVATASATEVCPNTAFTLTATGVSSGIGMTYQWMSAPVGSGTYTAIAGATMPYYTVTNQLAPTDYELVTTCTNGNLSATSSPVSVGQPSSVVCAYCTNLGGNAMPKITTLAIPGTTLNYTVPPWANSIGYTNIPPVGNNTGTLEAGTAYNITVTTDNSPLSTSPMTAGLWIDYDQSGSFSSSEFTLLADSVFVTASTSFVIPASAVTGQTRMRVRTVNSALESLGATDDCTSFLTGVTLDYTITMGPGTPCNGTPTAGTAAATLVTVCPNTTFGLSATGFSSGAGTTYRWQSSPAGTNTFANIPGATSPASFVNNQTVASDYRMIIKCGALSDTSNIVTVDATPAYTCSYCTQVGGSANMSTINGVVIPGTTLSNITTGAQPYAFFPISSNTTATLQNNATYVMSVTSDDYSVPYDSHMWIDYDHSGTFDVNEYTMVGDSVLGTGSAAFTVPASALPGITRLRVRTMTVNTLPLGAADACADYNGWGQTQDYMITIDPPVTCTGTPAGGTASASVTTTCPDQPFILTATGATAAPGVTYQWQTSAMGAGSFSDIPGATAPVYTIPTQGGASDYRLVATCANGGTDYSTLATVDQTPFYNCYCPLLFGSPYDASLDSVSIVGTTLDMYVPMNSNPYTAFPPSGNATANLLQGATYTIVVNSSGGSNLTAAAVSMWIDYDHNAVFDPSEHLEISPGIIGTESASFTVPAGALTGQTGMRIRSNSFTMPPGAGDACTTFYDGQTEDFVITIDPGSGCTGAPVAGTASALITESCADSLFSLYCQGYTTAGDIHFQWQSAAAGSGSFTDITGATSPVFTSATLTAPTDFRIVVSCANTGLSNTSNIVSIGKKPFYQCYCSNIGGASWDVELDSFAIQGTTLQIRLPYTNETYFTYPDTGVATATLQQGAVYTASATNELNTLAKYNMWIDYDHSSTFDANEHVLISDSAWTGTVIRPFAVPANAQTGLTRMRVRANTDPVLSSDACTYILNSETYNFLITIDPAVPCSGTVSAGNVGATAVSVCPDNHFTVYATDYTSGSGLVYQWQQAPAGTGSFTDIAGATMPVYDVISQLVATDYRMIATCTVTGKMDTSVIQSVNENAFYYCYCSPLNGYILFNNGASTISNITITGTSLASPAASYGNTAGYMLIPPYFPYNTATLDPGTTYSLNALLPVTPFSGLMPSVDSWIDFNQNGSYEVGEYTHLTTTDFLHYSANVTVPANALLGYTGMRISNSLEGPIAPTDVCGVINAGSILDFVISIGLCDTITGLSASGITDDGASITWNPVPGALDYQILVDQSSADPVGWAPTVSGTDSAVTGLTPGTTYYAHVRGRCGNGNYSQWVTVGFTTTLTGISNIHADNFSLHAYPNPVKDVVTVKVYSDKPATGSILITDVTGRTAETVRMTGQSVNINMGGFASGMYLLRYTDGVHTVTVRLTKQ